MMTALNVIRVVISSEAILYVMMQKEGDSEVPTYDTYINNYRHRIRLRDRNFKHQGVDMDGKPRIAQIKAIQKFIGRLKSDNKNYQAILAQMESLNLSKYLEEISALLANCVNDRDIQFYSEIATRLNLDYENYPSMLLKDLLKQFSNNYESQQDNKSRLKSLLLFLAELFVCGFPFPYKEISQMLKKLVKAGTKKKTNFTTEKQLRLFAYYYNCDIYVAFLKDFGTVFTVSTPRWMQKWVDEGKEVPQYPLMIPAKTREDFTNIFFTNYIASCSGVLQAAFERIKQLQDELHSNLKLSGEFNRQVQSNYNQLKQKFLFTKSQLEIIIEAIGSEATIRKYQQQLINVEDIMKKYINKVQNVEIFENEFEKQLYTELPEISKTQNKAATDQEYRLFKEKLDSCKNRHQSDEAIKAFETINNKRTRKLLAKDILQYRKEYQLVTPYLCRIAAAISQNFKDLTESLLQQVFAEYQKLRQSVSTNFVLTDKKSRNLKYICEFTKFKMVDPQKTIGVIQNFIEDLKGYNIELLISALESVGRFLYLAPQHANKFTFLLSKLQNVMKQKSLPLFTISQLLNSINLLKPHIETPKPPVPPPSPTQTEAQKVLSSDVISQLDNIIDGILRLIKKPGGLEAVQKELLNKIQQYDFLGNYHYAYLINQLEVEDISNWIINGTVSKLQEAVKTGNYQNCLLWSRFFAELYKYQLIKRRFLFDKLQEFMEMGKGEVGVINLVCTVLETCYGYLDSKKVSTKNQRFLLLVEFKKYIHRCTYVPMLEEFKIIDVLDELQPNLTPIKIDVLETFLDQNRTKNITKDFDLSKELDAYLQKLHLKEPKNQAQTEPKDLRIAANQDIQQKQPSEDRNSELMINQAKMFDSQFRNVMNSHIKDLSDRIAKPAIVEKVIEKKRERKKAGEGQQKRTIIGRCGNKFVKKEVVYAAKPINEDIKDIKEE